MAHLHGPGRIYRDLEVANGDRLADLGGTSTRPSRTYLDRTPPLARDTSMSRDNLTKMTKLEVVVTTADAPAVQELFTGAGATGYTSLSGVSGLGHGGYHQGRLLFNQQATLELLITVVPDDKADPLMEGLRALLEGTAGVMFVTDAYVSRPDYFT